MAPPFGAERSEITERTRIFRTLVPYFGTVQPSSFFQRTSNVVVGVERIHHLIEGIYKPAGAVYPLSIASMLKSPYRDQVFFNPDRTWWIQCSSKKEAMDWRSLRLSRSRCVKRWR